MKKIIQFFTPKGEQAYLDQLKTNALIIISFIGFVFMAYTLFNALVHPSDNYKATFISVILISCLLILNLVLVKYTNAKIAGNIFSFSLVFLIAVSLNMLNPNISTLYKYTQGFYSIIGLFTMGVLFVSKKYLLILNTLIIIATTTRVYLFAIIQLPEQKELLRSGYIIHTIVVVGVFIVVYYAIQFVEKTVKKLNEKVTESDEQNKTLLNLVAGIKGSSIQIFNASEQLSTISEQVSQNATEQAATTEEVSASMEQMLAMVEANTVNAELTGETSVKSSEEIKESNEIFIQTIKSISEISQKISIILEIANKTDILSINAAIEAARAGDSGKGFAVVANEIRKLADKTKLASEEITNLSLSGQSISEKAGQKLSELVPLIIKSSELVQKIVVSNAEQQSGINAINSSMQQLTEITNQNSASAEEMSSSAEQLSVQAEQLKKLISDFDIDK